MKVSTKNTLDLPSTLPPMLSAPKPSKDDPQNIQDTLLFASTRLLTTPNQSQTLLTSVAPSPDTHDTIGLKGNTLTYIWTNVINTPANVHPSENSVIKIQRSAHRKKITISLPTSKLK